MPGSELVRKPGQEMLNRSHLKFSIFWEILLDKDKMKSYFARVECAYSLWTKIAYFRTFAELHIPKYVSFETFSFLGFSPVWFRVLFHLAEFLTLFSVCF